MTRNLILQILLWISVIGWGCVFGGLLWETWVIVPLWSGAPPESLTAWNLNPQHVVDPTNYYRLFTSTTLLAMAAALIIGRGVAWLSRRWLLIALMCGLTATVWTIVFHLPRNVLIFQRHGAGISPDEIVSLTRQWLMGNWFRLATIGVGFVSMLRAFSSLSHAGGR